MSGRVRCNKYVLCIHATPSQSYVDCRTGWTDASPRPRRPSSCGGQTIAYMVNACVSETGGRGQPVVHDPQRQGQIQAVRPEASLTQTVGRVGRTRLRGQRHTRHRPPPACPPARGVRGQDDPRRRRPPGHGGTGGSREPRGHGRPPRRPPRGPRPPPVHSRPAAGAGPGDMSELV